MAAIEPVANSSPIQPYYLPNLKCYIGWVIGLGCGSFLVASVAAFAFANYYAKTPFIPALSGTLGGKLLIGFTVPLGVILGSGGSIMGRKYKKFYNEDQQEVIKKINRYWTLFDKPGTKSKTHEERDKKLNSITNELNNQIQVVNGNLSENHGIPQITDSTLHAPFALTQDKLKPTLNEAYIVDVQKSLIYLNALNLRRNEILKEADELPKKE